MLKGATNFVERVPAAKGNRQAGKGQVINSLMNVGFNVLKTANGATNRLVNAVYNFGETITAATLPAYQPKPEATLVATRTNKVTPFSHPTKSPTL